MKSPAPGDPGSISAAAAATRRAARNLDAAHSRTHAAYTGVKGVWGTSTSVRTRKQGAVVTEALRDCAAHADSIGGALQAYAQHITELQARVRAVHERARAAGFDVDGGVVVRPWGVSGEADPAKASGQEAALAAAQEELEAIAAHASRHRERLLATVEASRARLAEVSATVRLT